MRKRKGASPPVVKAAGRGFNERSLHPRQCRICEKWIGGFRFSFDKRSGRRETLISNRSFGRIILPVLLGIGTHVGPVFVLTN